MTNKFDKSDTKLRELYEEAFFQQLMEGYEEFQGEKLKREAEADIDNIEEPSAELISQMETKIAKEIGRQKQRKTIVKIQRFGKHVAVIFVVIAAVFSVSFVTVDAFRTRILNYFFEDQGVSTIHGIQQEQHGLFTPTYLPANMSIVLYSDESEPIEILLQSDDNSSYAHIYIFDNQTKVYSDTEDVKAREYVDINGVDGEYSEKEGRASLIWHSANQTYMAQMTSNLAKEEMVNIASSISF